MKLGQLITRVFHPLNFPIFGAFLYFITVPVFIYKKNEYLILGIIFIGTYLIPMLLLLILKGSLVQSFKSKVSSPSVFVYSSIATNYLIANWITRINPIKFLAISFYGFTACVIIYYLLFRMKFYASIYMIFVGSLLTFMLLYSYQYQINLLPFLVAILLISGILASALLSENNPKSELIRGYFIGILSQIIGYLFFIGLLNYKGFQF